LDRTISIWSSRPADSQKLPQIQEFRQQDGTFSVGLLKLSSPIRQQFTKCRLFGLLPVPHKIYAPYKDYVRSLFKPAAEVETKMQAAIACLRSLGKTVVGRATCAAGTTAI
jgi:hypothetical protein